MQINEFESDEILNGASGRKFITSVHFCGGAEVILYMAAGEDEKRKAVTETFKPFFLICDPDLLVGWTGRCELAPLEGNEHFCFIGYVEKWSDLNSIKEFIKQKVKVWEGVLHIINDPVQQYLIQSGNTMFTGMKFDDARRLQLDIETYSAGGFSNAKRKSDKIIIISLRDNTGWEKVLSGKGEDELITEMISEIIERDPDIIEGHNIFNFDLPYIETRAKRYKIKLTIGRDGSVATSYKSRVNIAEKRVAYKKYEIAGRSVSDTFILARIYDISTRSMESYGLKYLARYFGVAADDRTYIDGEKIAWYWDNEPKTLLQYAVEDVRETDMISRVLSQPVFYQAKIFPFSYQNTAVRGNAVKIDSIMLRSYLDKKHSIPGLSMKPRSFSGGYTDIMKEGVITDRVLNCDVQSLYPSVMLIHKFFPSNDSLGVFAYTLELLRKFRLEAKKEMKKASNDNLFEYYNALQLTFKILINSYYGYLGSSYGHFVDADQAENITGKGREIIKKMVVWLQEKNAEVIEVDTDGIYFVAPKGVETDNQEEEFVGKMSDEIEPELTIELAGRYKGMFSYKMKNYALLDTRGRLIIKGSGLRSRGLELFQRQFMEEMFMFMLSGKSSEVPALFERYREELTSYKWDIKMFQKKETLRETLGAYKEKRDQGARNQAAAYELSIAAGLSYGPGDQVAYYVTGSKKTVKVAENSRLASEWNKDEPDENIVYYEKKLATLYGKFEKYLG